MVSLNIVNFITISIITVLMVILVRFLAQAAGKASPV